MPGRHRLSLPGLMKEAAGAIADGIGMIEVFPAIADELKTESAEEAWNPDGLVVRRRRCPLEVHTAVSQRLIRR